MCRWKLRWPPFLQRQIWCSKSIVLNHKRMFFQGPNLIPIGWTNWAQFGRILPPIALTDPTARICVAEQCHDSSLRAHDHGERRWIGQFAFHSAWTQSILQILKFKASFAFKKVPKTLAKQSRVRDLYINYAFNEQDVVQKAAHINVTKSMNGAMTGYLPVHCICAMLHWRSFSKYSTPIQVCFEF